MDTPLSHRLYTAEQSRRLDEIAITNYGIPGAELMNRAGLAAWQILIEKFADVDEVVVFCGHGNNAGDGYVLATLAAQAWVAVTVWQVSDASQLKADALNAYCAAKAQGVCIKPFSDYQLSTGKNVVIVDALLGTGLAGEVSESFKKAIDAINDSACVVLSLDVPSGLDADTGSVCGTAVYADVTVTFIGAKQGLFTHDGCDRAGEVVLSDLSLRGSLFNQLSASAELVDYVSIQPLLYSRARNSHKGNFGHVLVIGGDYGYGGAVIMAAESALRVGAGCVSVATRPEHIGGLLARRPEVMAHGISDPSELNPLFAKANVVVIGAGLGQSSWAQGLWAAAVGSGLPLIVDADALNLLAQSPATKADWILTPHPGEAARLLTTSTADIQNNRFSGTKLLVESYGGAVVLKGAGSVLGYRHELMTRLAVCHEGNPGMATAGMGDVLSGVLGGLRAQGWSVAQALQIGVCVHARAGDLAATTGERGLVASDLMPYLQQLVNME